MISKYSNVAASRATRLMTSQKLTNGRLPHSHHSCLTTITSNTRSIMIGTSSYPFASIWRGGSLSPTSLNLENPNCISSNSALTITQTLTGRRWVSSIDGVKVDVTKIVGESKEDNTDSNGSGGCGGGGCGSGMNNTDDAGNENEHENGTKPKLKKSQQQEAEEELSLLNSHVREHFNHANYSAALETSQEMLDKCTTLFGPSSSNPHPATASSHNNIGLMHKMMGDFESSRFHYHEALKIYEVVVGKDHESYAAALNNLGNLDRTQSMVGIKSVRTTINPDDNDDGINIGNEEGEEVEEEQLSTIERMQLNDSAVDYFEEAWNIRKVELGEEHVYTVTSRTNLGGAIAAQVLYGEMLSQKRLKEKEEKKQKNDANNGDGAKDKSEDEDTDTDTESDSDKDTAASYAVSKYTKEKWDAAEEHLRAAFRTSVNNPRGEQVVVPQKSSSSSSSSSHGTKKMDKKNMSKREKQKASKLRKKKERKEQRMGNNNTSTSIGQDGNNLDNNGLGVGDIKICTLSSAATGQNLAVFLKLRADLISSSPTAAHGDLTLDSGDMYGEAKSLYLGALRVRNSLKGKHHPDTVATKFSLAELMDAMGDEKGANVLRQLCTDNLETKTLR